MNRIVTSILCALILGSGSLWAADLTATVTKITGKAQIQKGSEWLPLAVGQVLVAGNTISTGFRSELLLKIGPSTVTIKALSRLTLKDLTQSGSEVTTDMYLKVGKIDAEVNKSETVTSQKFSVSSPVATASVRGTAFSFDGVKLQVLRGLVDFSDARGNLVHVPVGEEARVSSSATGGLSTNQDIVAENSTTQREASDSFGTVEDESFDTWDDWDYSDLLDFWDEYDWWEEMPSASIYIGGIY